MNDEIESTIADIRAETESILTDEPEDIERMRKGVIPSNAGSYGQYLSPLLFAQSEVRGMSVYAVPGLLEFAREDVPIDHLKTLSKILLDRRAGFVRFCGLFDYYDVFQAYFDALEHVETTSEFIELTETVHMYGTKVHDWLEFAFPWEFGHMLPHLSPEDIDRLSELTIEYEETYFEA